MLQLSGFEIYADEEGINPGTAFIAIKVPGEDDEIIELSRREVAVLAGYLMRVSEEIEEE